MVVAPLVKEVLMESFAILKIPPQEGGIPLDSRYWIDLNTYTVDNYLGMEVAKIRPTYKYQFSIHGTGKTVIAQTLKPGEKLIEAGLSFSTRVSDLDENKRAISNANLRP